MKNIWKYSTQKNGLLSNNISDIVSGPGGLIHAATDKGIFSSKDKGATWQAEVEGPDADSGEIDICVSQSSGKLLFTYMDDRGLGVKSNDIENPNYITQEKDGIYSNKVNSVQIDESSSANDPLGAVYITHYSGALFGGEPPDRTISRYKIQSKTWEILQPPEFAGIVQAINTIKFFNKMIYVCADGALAISKDGVTWNVITELNVNPTPVEGYGVEPGVPIDVRNFYIDSIGTWYLMCTYQNMGEIIAESFVLRSIDHGSTWDALLYSDRTGFTGLEGFGDELFCCSGEALRVIGKKKESLRLFNNSNGLNIGELADEVFGPDKFIVQQDKVYVPTSSGVAIADMSDIAQYPRIWDYATTKDGLSSNTILCLDTANSSSKAGPVFAGSKNGLMGSTDGGASWQQVDAVTRADLKGQQINDISSSWMINQDYYALGTEQIGLVICSNPFTPSGFGWHLTTADGLASNRIQCVLADLHAEQINAYLGHMGEGLTVVMDGKGMVFNKTKGLAGNFVLSIRDRYHNGKHHLYACGYDLDPIKNVRRAALSISDNNGNSWSAINQFTIDGIDNVPLTAVYDVWYDATADELYGIFSEGTGTMLLLMKSTDNGKSWDLVVPSLMTIDSDIPGCTPKIFNLNKQLYIATYNVLNIYDLELKELGYAFWADGLQGSNTGAISIDKNGQIYTGSNGLGVAISNVEYIPMYDFNG